MDDYTRNRYGNMVWSKTITHSYPEEGVVLPYQEYLQAGRSTDGILIEMDGDLARRFKYVCRELSDDDTCTLIEMLIESVKKLKADGYVRDAGFWDEKLRWLNAILSEVWHGRGLYPGIGSILDFLGFENGTEYAKNQLATKLQKGQSPKDFIFNCLEGRQRPPQADIGRFITAAAKWKVIKEKEPTLAKLLKERLCLFELSTDQVRRICDVDERETYCITS